MQVQSIRALFLLILLLASAALACNLPGSGEEAADPSQLTATSLAATVTALAPVIDASPTSEIPETQNTPTLVPEEPPAPDVPTLEPPPTAEPGEPTMTTLVALNVRRGPGTNYDVVGALHPGSSARIVGRNPDTTWWKIECPPSTGTECWSSALPQYSSAENAENVPVAPIPPPPTHTPTYTPTYTPSSTPTYTPSPTPTLDGTTTVTYTPSPTLDATPTSTYTPTPTSSATPMATNTPTATSTP